MFKEALKILLLSLLLTVVYSWGDFKNTVKIFFLGLFRKNTGAYYLSHSDQIVSTIILLATIPLALIYFLVSDAMLVQKLIVMIVALLALSIFAAGSEIFLRRIKAVQDVEGADKIMPITFAVIGLFSPVFNSLKGHGVIQRSILAKFSFLLSLPAMLGLVLKYLTGYISFEYEFLPYLDLLIYLLVGSLIIRIAIDFLEWAFRAYRLEKLFSYYRIALGIALAVIIIMGLV